MPRRISTVLATCLLLALLPLWTPTGGVAKAEEKVKGAYGASPKAAKESVQMRAAGALGAGTSVKGSYDCTCSGGKDGQDRCRTIRTVDTLQCDKADTNACSGSCKLTVVISGGNNIVAPQ